MNTHVRCDTCLKPLPFGAVSGGYMRHPECANKYMEAWSWYNAQAVREGLDAERERAWQAEKAHATAAKAQHEVDARREADLRRRRVWIPTFHPSPAFDTVTGTERLDGILRAEARAFAVNYHDALPVPRPTYGGERVWRTSFEEQSVPYQDERVAAAEHLLRDLSVPASFDAATRRLGRLAGLQYVGLTAPTWTRYAWGWELRGRGVDVVTFGKASNRAMRSVSGLNHLLFVAPPTEDEEALILCLLAVTQSAGVP